MEAIRQSGGIRERNVIERMARRLVCWLKGHNAPAMSCLRCSRTIYR